MGEPTRAVVVGSLNGDLVLSVPIIPVAGVTVPSTRLQRFAGGKGANQAVALARLGAEVAMVGAVGDDAEGAFLLDVLKAEGIDVTRVRTLTGQPTGLAVIAVDERGENAIMVVAGANGEVHAPSIEAATDFSGVGLLLLQLETPMDAVLRAARSGRAAGALVVLNAAPAVPLDASLLSTVDALVVNSSEAWTLSGERDPAAAAAALRAAGPSAVVVTLGAEGSIVDDGSMAYLPAFPVEVVDTTGAGDCFSAAFGLELSRGRSASEAGRFAAAASALAVTSPGAQAMPTRAEVEIFLASR